MSSGELYAQIYVSSHHSASNSSCLMNSPSRSWADGNWRIVSLKVNSCDEDTELVTRFRRQSSLCRRWSCQVSHGWSFPCALSIQCAALILLLENEELDLPGERSRNRQDLFSMETLKPEGPGPMSYKLKDHRSQPRILYPATLQSQ